MKNKLFSLLLVVLVLAGVSFGQAALNMTTLSAAVTGGSGVGSYSGIAGGLQSSVVLASVTNLVAPVNGAVQSLLYIDDEAMAVLAINTTTKVVTVQRGYGGTAAVPHANGAMVLFGLTSQFYAVDPKPGSACLGTGTVVTPYVNIVSGNQWLCSSISGTWVPGFQNSASPAGVTTAVASAASPTPSGPLFHMTGTTTVSGGWTVPVGMNATAAGSTAFCVIPDGIATINAAGNIALASTTVVNKILCYTWDGTNSKFVPSY